MKAIGAMLFVASLLPAVVASSSSSSPVSKVMTMLSDLEAKVVKEGEEAQKVFDDFSAWCEERSRNIGFEIKTGKAQIEDLNAAIEKSSSDATALSTKIEELSGSISTDEADLKSATSIRESEAAEFAVASKELHEVINTLERAISILEHEMSKGGASMMQLEKAGDVVQALNIMLQASAISSSDATRLTALVQSADPDDDSQWGAPAAKVYEGHSGGILDTLNSLLEKANGQLETTQKKEMNAKHNFDMLKQSLTDEIKYANKDMTEAKKALAQAQSDKATAEGDLSVTSADLKQDLETKNTLKYDCMTKSTDFEAATKSRAEELKALAAAKKAIASMTGGADSLTYGLNQVSLLQLAQDSNVKITSGTDLANFEAVRFVRDLARKENSPALAQLAARMATAIRLGTNAGDDPFAKVKGLIRDMLHTLQQEAQADATHKEYCDKQIGETMTKKQEATTEIEKLSTKIDMASTRSAKLKDEVADLQKELAELATSQAQMDKVRMEEKTTFKSNKEDMEQGLEGVKMALNILRDYYAKEAAHEASVGAGQGIIGLLEVVESDFSKGLAEMTAEEDAAQNQYDATTKDNEITRASKNQDVKYKTKEAIGLDKDVAELTSDREGVQAELSAITEYLGKLDKMCVDKGETYAERTAHREAEIAGLKEALKILQGEAVLLQSNLRGVRKHLVAKN
jgi:chromosome segregation ATPase